MDRVDKEAAQRLPDSEGTGGEEGSDYVEDVGEVELGLESRIEGQGKIESDESRNLGPLGALGERSGGLNGRTGNDLTWGELRLYATQKGHEGRTRRKRARSLPRRADPAARLTTISLTWALGSISEPTSKAVTARTASSRTSGRRKSSFPMAGQILVAVMAWIYNTSQRAKKDVSREVTNGRLADSQLDELSKELPELELDGSAFLTGRVAEVVEVVEPRSQAVDVAGGFRRSGELESRSEVDDDAQGVRWRGPGESLANG